MSKEMIFYDFSRKESTAISKFQRLNQYRNKDEKVLEHKDFKGHKGILNISSHYYFLDFLSNVTENK